jgi:hypothetical protein
MRSMIPVLLYAALPAAAQGQWVKTTSLNGDYGPSSGDYYFARSLAASPALLVVGAPGYTTGPGLAYVFAQDGAGAWLQSYSLQGSSSAALDDFGRATAVDGDTVWIGAPGQSGAIGRAYAFDLVAGSWIESFSVTAPVPEHDDEFGRAVAVAGDVALVGAPKLEQVFAYQRAAGAWSLVQTLAPADSDEFGAAIAFDGATAVIGAPNAATAYVFELGPGGFALVDVLAGQNASEQFEFGSAVALDGSMLAVGAPGDDGGIGSVSVFERAGPPGSPWTMTAELKPASANPDAMFGTALALRAGRLLVGSPLDEEGLGAAYVFELLGGAWIETGQLEPGLGTVDGTFGSAVAITHAGELLTNVGLDGVGPFGAGTGYTGTIFSWSDAPGLLPDLFAFPAKVSLASGGTQILAVQAGSAQAGKIYLVLGSASGTTPGIDVGGVHLPLEPDPYLDFTLANPGAMPLVGSVGVLDAEGEGGAQFGIPAGLSPDLIGLSIAHAFVVIDVASPDWVVAASNAAGVVVGP